MRRRAFVVGLGSATAWTVAARAQQPARTHRIAIVHPAFPTTVLTSTGGNPYYRMLFEELQRLGHVEGRNLVVDRHSGHGRSESYAELAREVIHRSPDLIFTVTTRMVRHFKEQTATIPIVGVTSDPVALGLVTSLARPGGNVTGVVADAGIVIWEKRLEIVKEMMPRATRAGFVVPRTVWEGVEGRTARDIAQQVGLAAVGSPLESPIQDEEYRRVIRDMFKENAEVLVVGE